MGPRNWNRGATRFHLQVTWQRGIVRLDSVMVPDVRMSAPYRSHPSRTLDHLLLLFSSLLISITTLRFTSICPHHSRPRGGATTSPRPASTADSGEWAWEVEAARVTHATETRSCERIRAELVAPRCGWMRMGVRGSHADTRKKKCDGQPPVCSTCAAYKVRACGLTCLTDNRMSACGRARRIGGALYRATRPTPSGSA
jgi:hypothetical protein